jgi:hypothetical protein
VEDESKLTIEEASYPPLPSCLLPSHLFSLPFHPLTPSSGHTIDNQAFDEDDNTSLAVPSKANFPGKVLDIATGGSFNIALLEDGTLLSWGKNFDGQLGGVWEPRSMEDAEPGVLEEGEVLRRGLSKRAEVVPPGILRRKQVRGFGCSYERSFAILEGGELLVWGKDQDPFWQPKSSAQKIVVRVPVPYKEQIWAKIFQWIVLGRFEGSSVFHGLPVEVLYHVIYIYLKSVRNF